MSPGAALRFFPFAIRRLTLLGRRGTEINAPARGVHPLDPDADRIAEAQHGAALLSLERRALLVDVPPVAAHAPDRQEALVALVAERHEGTGADQPHHLALEVELVARLLERALEQERLADVLRRALDLHRVPLGCGALETRLLHVLGARCVVLEAERGEQP